MRMLGIAAAVLLLAACGTAEAATSLRITAWPGNGEKPKTWTLRCPGDSTLPRPERACKRLQALSSPFAPVAKGVACSQIFGGPQRARVSGTFRGKKVEATFKRTDGCEIARWNRVGFLFPIFTGTLPPPR